MPKSTAYLTISQAARILGVSQSSLRNWERIGLIAPVRAQGRYRRYSREVLEQAKRIRYLRKVEGLNPHGILHVLRSTGGGRPASRSARNAAATIGARLLRLRQQQGLTLTQAARKAGVSTSFLSAIERDQANPSVATFQKLAQLYDTNVASFFGADIAPRRLVHPRERKSLEPQPGIRIETLAFNSKLLEPQVWHIAAGAGSGGSYHHDGEEFIFVLEGKLEIWLDEIERYIIGPGDCLCFESTHAHSWRNIGNTETVLLWVNTPPTF